jgi:hypothetical protein
MKISGSWVRSQISGCLLLALAMPFVTVGASAQQAENSKLKAEEVSSAQTQSDSGSTKNTQGSQSETLPDSPGSARLQMIADNRIGGQEPPPQQRQSGTPPPNATQQSGTQPPVGTAASESVKATGVAASQPAGAAIAPAKQRRTRSILIKVGALVGAGVAIGTVVGLSSASPSRPR